MGSDPSPTGSTESSRASHRQLRATARSASRHDPEEGSRGLRPPTSALTVGSLPAGSLTASGSPSPWSCLPAPRVTSISWAQLASSLAWNPRIRGAHHRLRSTALSPLPVCRRTGSWPVEGPGIRLLDGFIGDRGRKPCLSGRKLCLVGSFLVCDVARDDVQWWATARSGEARRGPEPATHPRLVGPVDEVLP